MRDWMIGCAMAVFGLPSLAVAAPVDEARILAAGNDVWLTHGRNYSETRESPGTATG